MRVRFATGTLAVLVSVLLVGTLTAPSAQAVTREWGRLHLSVRGMWQAEAYGTAGWKNGQPRVVARYVDYNGMHDNDSTFVQAEFYKYESWVCGINGQKCYGYRLKGTGRTVWTWEARDWYTDVVRLGHRAVGRWTVRARVCDHDHYTKHRACSGWSRYLRVH